MKKLSIVIAVLGIWFLPAFAKAASYSDNFDDGVMNPALWSYHGDTGGTGLYEIGGVLNFVSDGRWEHGSADYSSTWTLDLSNDFWMRTDFNFSHVGGDGGVGFGIDQGPTGTGFAAGIGAEWSDREGSNPVFWIGIEDSNGDPVVSEEVNRSINSGWLGMHYNYAADTLEFGAFDQSDNSVAGASYTNFRTTYGPDLWRVGIGGFADNNTVIGEGDANLDNFQATTAPEPVSTILFLTGGAVLVGRRLQKRAKKSISIGGGKNV